MNEGKGNQETESVSKGMGSKHRGAEQADKTGNGNGKKAQRKNNRNSRSDIGEGTADKNRVDSGTKKRLIIGIMERMWICHGRAQKDGNCRTRERDLDIVGIQESWEKEGGDWVRSWRVRRERGKRKGQNGKNRGARGVGFLVKEYLCDIMEVTQDTIFDEGMWTKIPEPGAKYYFLGNVYMPPQSKNAVKDIQRKSEK